MERDATADRMREKRCYAELPVKQYIAMAYPYSETGLNFIADHLQKLEMCLNSFLYQTTKYHPENPK